MQTRIQETSAIWFQHFLGKKKWHFRSWHCLAHLNSTADQHLGLVLHALTTLSVLYIQKQLHWLAGSAKKREIFKKIQPSKPSLSTTAGRGGPFPSPSTCEGSQQSPPKSIQNQTAQDISAPWVLQVTFTGLIPPHFFKLKQIRFPFRSAAKHPGLMPHHHPNKASWSLILHLSSHTQNTFQEPVNCCFFPNFL